MYIMNLIYFKENFKICEYLTDEEINELNIPYINIDIINQDTIYDILYFLDYYQYIHLNEYIKKIQKYVFEKTIHIDINKLNNINLSKLIFDNICITEQRPKCLYPEIYENINLTQNKLNYNLYTRTSCFNHSICIEYYLKHKNNCIYLNEDEIIDIIKKYNDIDINKFLDFCNYGENFNNYCIKLFEYIKKYNEYKNDSNTNWMFNTNVCIASQYNGTNLWDVGHPCGYHTYRKCVCKQIQKLKYDGEFYTKDELTQINECKCGEQTDKAKYKFLKCYANDEYHNIPNIDEDLYTYDGEHIGYYPVKINKKKLKTNPFSLTYPYINFLKEYKTFINNNINYKNINNYKTINEILIWSKDNNIQIYEHINTLKNNIFNNFELSILKCDNFKSVYDLCNLSKKDNLVNDTCDIIYELYNNIITIFETENITFENYTLIDEILDYCRIHGKLVLYNFVNELNNKIKSIFNNSIIYFKEYKPIIKV